MKTRKQSEGGGKEESSGTLNDISQDAVGKGLRRANANLARIRKNDNVRQCQTIEPESGSRNRKKQSIGDSECYSKYKESSASSRMEDNTEREEEMDESDWEDGPSHTLDSRDNCSNDQIKEVTIEFNALPDSSKRKPVHRASAEDKEVAELVHKVHLLCLLARGRIIDNACDDPLIQASLLSILPKYLLRISNVQKFSPKDLAPLVSWFHENFHVKGPCTRERLYPSTLAYALERREGTPEEIAALSVALFRALNFTTRFVSILDVASLKPESSNEAAIKSVQGIFSSSTPMVHTTNMVSTTPLKISPCHDEENIYARDGPKRKNRVSDKTNQPVTSHTSDQLMDGILDSLATGSPNCTKETPKRKGDFEFEMQLEMALAATATGDLEDNMNLELSNVENGASNFLSLGKRLKRNKSDELSTSSRGISTAIGSKKVGSPLYWAEIYFDGENLTGKWVHVDAVNAIIDGENNVEAAAVACKTSLRYVVAFAGRGAKDVTRRYCMKWYKISSQRISLSWWDSVLAPLKALESGATTGLVGLPRESGIESLEEDFKNSHAESSVMSSLTNTRTSLEDLELETRALTEPLPTNQQAYKNHQLYALERWLTKYQTLHPKGPVLGFCSGHPVYPRTCVQTLRTKERWLREGLQLKSDELPTKVLRRPHKLKLVEVDDVEGDCGETIALYGKWQMEPLFLPRAVNGIVPRNERGQVDVWSEKCLPPGTVHLRLPRVYTVAKRLEIDSAPAMVGFEFRNGRSFPVFDGIVVCAEFKDAILEAYAEEAAEREVEEKRRNEEKAISRWYQLLSSIVTRQRLNNCYGSDPLPQTTNDMPSANHKPHIKVGGSGDGEQSFGSQQEHVQDKEPYSSRPGSIEDHIHVFLKEDQKFDEESLVWTKRCHCGFSIEVEEF